LNKQNCYQQNGQPTTAEVASTNTIATDKVEQMEQSSLETPTNQMNPTDS